MGPAHRPPRRNKHNTDPPPLRRDITEADVRALQEKNAELRELVVQLSTLAIKGLLDRM